MESTLSYWWFRLTSLLRWYRGASTRYDVHSPFLSEFVREVYCDTRHFHAFDAVREVRRFWRGRGSKVKLQSLGAPSRSFGGKERSAARLVSSNAVNDRSGKFLFRLSLWHRPERIVEFGTNAGISTLYLHLADPRVPLTTVEGNPAIAALARDSFARTGVGDRLTAAVATFRDWLHHRPASEPCRLLFFLDGDHRYAPTLEYVETMLREANDESVIVVADIHWSRGMERAWRELQGHPRVTASVDTYHFGLLFLRPGLNGPHVSLIPTRYKPWRVGFL